MCYYVNFNLCLPSFPSRLILFEREFLPRLEFQARSSRWWQQGAWPSRWSRPRWRWRGWRWPPCSTWWHWQTLSPSPWSGSRKRERLIVLLECQKLLISIRFPFAGKLKLIRAIHQRNLLWRNFESLCPHVNFLVNIHTGNDEEHTGAPGSSRQEPS